MHLQRLQQGSFNWDLESSISIHTRLAQPLAAWKAKYQVRKFLRQADREQKEERLNRVRNMLQEKDRMERKREQEEKERAEVERADREWQEREQIEWQRSGEGVLGRISHDTGKQISAEEDSVTESFLSQLDQCLAEEKLREAELEGMLAAERQNLARVKAGRQRPAEEEKVTPGAFLSQLDQCLAEEKLREAELEAMLAAERQNCTRPHPYATVNGHTV